MIKGLYTSCTSMINQQQRMDIISNNLANVSTTGYKKDSVVVESFEDVLAVKLDPKQYKPIGTMNLGVKIGDIYTDFKQGSFVQTNNIWNLAIQGDGFFSVGVLNEQGNLETRYTRDGSFTISQNGDVMTEDGFYLIGEDGNKITLPKGNVRISETGDVYVNDELVNKLKVVNFEDKTVLKKIGDNLYSTNNDQQPNNFNGLILQGYLEASNVNTIKEMVDMINVMRTYESNQKVIQTLDESLGKAVNEVGRL